MKEIRETNNYDMFKRLEGNRIVDTKRIEKIKKSILKVGYISSPILVNEKMEIIDGQGRYEALKELQLPIEYIVQEGIGIKECVAMNVHQTNWKMIDYVNSYADRGIQSYIFVRDLMKRFKINNISIIAVATCGIGTFRSELIKSGSLEITKEQYMKAVANMDYLKEILGWRRELSRVDLLFKGLLFCVDIDGIDLKRLKEKALEVLEIGKLPPIPTIEETMQFIEEMYNKNSKRPTLYIYTEYRKQVEGRKAKAFIELNEKHRMMKYLANSLKEEETEVEENEGTNNYEWNQD